jgi:hypothetical protein
MFVNDFFSRQYSNSALLVRNRLIMKQNELNTSKKVFDTIGEGLKRDLKKLSLDKTGRQAHAGIFCKIYGERNNSQDDEEAFEAESKQFPIFKDIIGNTNHVY